MLENLMRDRDMIERKYHIPEKEFNSFQRMAYHGYDYDETTGLDDGKIDKELSKLSATLEGESHTIQKAKLFEFVLDNTRIDVNESDYFVGIYTWNRPLSKYTWFKWLGEVHSAFPKASATVSDFHNSGATQAWLDFDHTVPDWDSLLELGFSGILERAEKSYNALKEKGELTEKQEAFYRAIDIEYRAILRLIDRLHDYALTKTHDKAKRVAKCLEHLSTGGAQDIYDAMQIIYLYFMLSESIDNYQVRSLGYGLDASLYPYFKKDIESGRYTKDEVAEFLGYFLMQWSAIGNYWGQPIYLAGTNTDGTTKVNELSYMILDVYDRLGIYNPKIQIKISPSTPKDFVCRALEMIRHGVSSIVFCNEEIIIKSLMSRGATYDVACDSVISGCYEYKTKRGGVGISGTYINALKPVSLVFENGFDSVSKKQIGPKTGNVEEFKSFEDFYRAYLKQLEHVTLTIADAMGELERRVQDINPSIMFSATLPECTETMTDALDGGIENNSSFLLCGLGTAVDALMSVYELVFEKKVTTLSEMKRALENNWEGFEVLRKMALGASHKYGNGDKISDSYALAITRTVADLLHGRRNSHGGRCGLELHSARMFILHGEKTLATPDGRRAGEEMSKNASPTPGADRQGITSLIHSATAIDSSLCDTGFCLDAMLHPSAVQGEEGMEALYAVLRTYMNKGGASIHFNIFNAELLKDAQKNPDKYKNLQVRICGWNALWNNLDKKEQDAYILRAENIR